MSNETESSLPQAPTYSIHSSPPSQTRDSSLLMEDGASECGSAVAQGSQQTPTSPGHERMNTDETERPASAQQIHDGLEDHLHDGTEEHVSDDEEGDPAIKITEFDWTNLHQNYHDAIKSFKVEEDELMQEWASLMEYFRIWADSGHEHETDRTFRRLQTRTMYVQNEEEKLEETRNHYVNVVRAFESALNLLKQNTMFRG